MKPNHSNSDNLKEQIGDILYKYNDIDGHYDFEPATNQLLQLMQDYAMGCVPEERDWKREYSNYPPHLEAEQKAIEYQYSRGYNQARQDFLDNLKGKK